MGAQSVTSREETPFSGSLTSTGCGGRGEVTVLGSASTTKAVQATFVDFN